METGLYCGRSSDVFLKLDLRNLVEGYRICAQSEGKSPSTIAIVCAVARYLRDFLITSGLPTDVANIGVEELRQFIIQLQKQQRFAHHPFTRPQEGELSGHTINGYMRGLRAFWSWLVREGIVTENPFDRVRIPKAPKKVIPTFTEEQLRRLFAAIDTGCPLGCRDYAIIVTFFDTGIRSGELTNLRLHDVNLEARLLKVWGKGAKERMVPIGAKVQRALWKYSTLYRPQPAAPRYDNFFLNRNGRPLTKDRVGAIVERYARKVEITGVRASPHTFRHTMAITFIRNGGDIFSLQRILGHAQLDVLRVYVNLAQSDVSRAHQKYSPADNLEFKLPQGHSKKVITRKAPAPDLLTG